jgi:hypothetical protein
MGGKHLNQPIVAVVPTPSGSGYWLIGSDGGAFGFSAPFRGSLAHVHLHSPINAAAAYGNGYLLFASDGGVFDLSNGTFYGSAAGMPGGSVSGGDAAG